MRNKCLEGCPLQASGRGPDQWGRRARLQLTLAAALLWSTLLPAAEFSVNGFGSVGIAHLDKPAEWAYPRSTTQRTNDADLRADLDSVIGLQLNYSPTRNLELVAQATFSALDSSANASDYIGLAFAAWRPHSDWTVRVGRVNLDAYLYSDHRDVG